MQGNIFKITLALAALVSLVAGCGGGARPLSPTLTEIRDATAFKGGRWGLHVVDLQTGEVLHALATEDLFRTASTAKVFSVSAALAALGPDYRFETSVLRIGRLDQGTLTGDLVLRASGDLTLGGRTKADGTISITDFDHTDANILPGNATLTPEDPLAGLDQLARQVRAAGVQRVAGDVLIDDRLWETISLDGVPISPIVVNDNLIDFVVTPGAGVGASTSIDWRPKTAAYTPRFEVKTGAADSQIDLQITDDGAGLLTLKGSVPLGKAPVVHTFQIAQPDAFARTLFIEALARAGVAVSASALGANSKARLPDSAELDQAPSMALLKSPPFSEQARLINKVSHNLGANQLPFLLGAQRGTRNYEAGLELERAFIAGAGVDRSLFTISDGQGLEGCTVAPSAMTRLLRTLATRPDFDTFFNSMPIIGVDGSLASVLPEGDPARGNAHAKTGTLVGQTAEGQFVLQSKALAGYIDTRSGRRLAFAIYLNDVPIDSVEAVFDANRAIGQMVSALYQAY